MTVWVLILLFSGSEKAAMTTVGFSTKSRCEKALATSIKHFGDGMFIDVKGLCVEK